MVCESRSRGRQLRMIELTMYPPDRTDGAIVTGPNFLSKTRRGCVMNSVDTTTTEDTDPAQATHMPTSINLLRRGRVCQAITRLMEACGRKTLRKGTTGSHTTTATLSIITSLRSVDWRDRSQGANRRNENRSNGLYPQIIVHQIMPLHRAVGHRGTTTQRLTDLRDTIPQIPTAHRDMGHLTIISHRGEHRLILIRQKEAPGLLSDCIEIFSGESKYLHH